MWKVICWVLCRVSSAAHMDHIMVVASSQPPKELPKRSLPVVQAYDDETIESIESTYNSTGRCVDKA